MLNNRIVIGTAQFGSPYGVANTKLEEVSPTEVSGILKYALSEGINTIDTAINYGDSEAKLGGFGVDDFQIVTKLPAIPNNYSDINSWVEEQLNNSFDRLKVRSIYGVLLHNSQDLLGFKGPELWESLQELKRKKIVKKVGYSIYSPWELDELYEPFPPDIVQAPYNILDRRLSLSGWLDRLSSNDIEIHIRSVFLQGLLLLNKNCLLYTSPSPRDGLLSRMPSSA